MPKGVRKTISEIYICPLCGERPQANDKGWCEPCSDKQTAERFKVTELGRPFATTRFPAIAPTNSEQDRVEVDLAADGDGKAWINAARLELWFTDAVGRQWFRDGSRQLHTGKRALPPKELLG